MHTHYMLLVRLLKHELARDVGAARGKSGRRGVGKRARGRRGRKGRRARLVRRGRSRRTARRDSWRGSGRSQHGLEGRGRLAVPKGQAPRHPVELSLCGRGGRLRLKLRGAVRGVHCLHALRSPGRLARLHLRAGDGKGGAEQRSGGQSEWVSRARQESRKVAKK